jgi:hypothetical protein
MTHRQARPRRGRAQVGRGGEAGRLWVTAWWGKGGGLWQKARPADHLGRKRVRVRIKWHLGFILGGFWPKEI